MQGLHCRHYYNGDNSRSPLSRSVAGRRGCGSWRRGRRARQREDACNEAMCVSSRVEDAPESSLEVMGMMDSSEGDGMS